jgi:DNA-directed RNA polymerase
LLTRGRAKRSIRFGKKTKKVILRAAKQSLDKLNKNKQVNAIIPNIIHSLDSSHLINLINTIIIINFKPFICVHDCFVTHSNNLEYLSFLVKKKKLLSPY